MRPSGKRNYFEPVRFQNERGVILAGCFHPGPGEIGILLLHSFTGDKSEHGRFDRAAARFNRDGLPVLQLDFAGAGESEEDVQTLARRVADVSAALDFLQARGLKRFGVLGLGLGGLVALQARDARIAALVLWAPILEKCVKGMPLLPGQRVELGGEDYVVVRKQTGPRREVRVGLEMLKELRQLDARAILVGVTLEVLILHGDQDKLVPLENSEAAVKLLPAGSRLHVVPGADHHFARETDMFVEASADWFRGHLVKKNPTRNRIDSSRKPDAANP